MIKPQKWKGIIDIKNITNKNPSKLHLFLKTFEMDTYAAMTWLDFEEMLQRKLWFQSSSQASCFFFLFFNTGQKAASRLRRQVEGERAGQDRPTRLWNSFGSSLWTKRPLCQKQKGKGSFEHSGPRPASVHATASAGDNRAAVSAERRRCTVDVARLHSESRHFSTAKHLRRDRARRPLEPHETRLTGDLASPMLLQADDKTQGERKENYNSHG